jgi:hypothetical protein
MSSIQTRTRVSKNSVMMRLGAIFFVATGLFFGSAGGPRRRFRLIQNHDNRAAAGLRPARVVSH